MSIGKGKLSRGAFSGRVRDLMWIVWWARGVRCFGGRKGAGWGSAGSGALAGDKHGLISDSCRNQNIVCSCILMSWMSQWRSVHALIYSIYFVYSPCLFNNRDCAH